MSGTGVSESRVGRPRAAIDERESAFLTRHRGSVAVSPARRDLHQAPRRRAHRRPRRDGGRRRRRRRPPRGARRRHGASEAEAFRIAFRRALADRGLHRVQLVIADDRKRLGAAARRVFDATRQRCRVHRAGSALAHVRAGSRAAVEAALKTILARQAGSDAGARRDAVADALRENHPELGASMDASREDALACMDFPRERRSRIADTNPPGRLDEETSAARRWSGSSPKTKPSFAPSARRRSRRGAVARRRMGRSPSPASAIPTATGRPP